MTNIRTLSIGIALGCTVVVGGCSSEPGPQTSTPTATSETISEPAPSTEPPGEGGTATTTAAPTLSAQEQDEEAIAATLEEYEAARMAAMRGEESIEGIYPFSSGTAREQWTTQVMSYEAQGLTISGQTALEVIDMSISDGNAEVIACLDVSDFDAVDADGESIVPEDRLDRTLVDYVLERAATAEQGWLVTEDVNRDEPCDD